MYVCMYVSVKKMFVCVCVCMYAGIEVSIFLAQNVCVCLSVHVGAYARVHDGVWDLISCLSVVGM